MQPVMTSWHVMTLVTFHDMLWHLHEPPRHDMRTMSRRLMPSQGWEPETHWCPETDFGSSLMHLSDPVWYIYILDPIWCIRFRIRSDIQHTLHFLIQLSQHTRTHSREGALNDHQMLKSCSCISSVGSTLMGSTLMGSTLMGSTLVESIPPSSSGCWGKLWGEYSTEFLSANIPRNSLVNAFFALLRRQMHDRAARWWLHHVRIVIVLHGVVTILLLRIYWVPMSTD